MTLTELRTLYATMIKAESAYKKADPLDVHNAYAALKAIRFSYNLAAGQYVAKLLENEE